MGTNLRQNPDGSVSMVDDTAGEVSRCGGSSAALSYKNTQSAKVALAITSGNGGAFSWSPPNGATVIITSVVLDIISGVAQTISIGTAANATTSSANLIDTLTQTTGTYDNITDKGTNGKSRQKLTAGQFVTGTHSATATGLVANVYISYTPM